jgi:hypothetical protein
MILVSSIKQSSRGKGKGFGWTVELNTPGVYGNIDSQTYAAIAVTEIIDAIRASWAAGRRVDGRPGAIKPDTRLRRRIQKFVLLDDPDFDHYHQYVVDWIYLKMGWKGKTNTRARKMMQVSRDRYDKWKQDQFDRHMMRVPAGEIGKGKVWRRYVPNPDGPAIDSSGLMKDGLRGKLRNARTATINKKPVVIRQHVELRVPKSRQRTAAWAGGLTQGNTDGITRTFAHMPLTGAFMRDAIRWQNLEARATNFFTILRLLRLAARVLT